MFEHRREPLLPRPEFMRRLLRHGLLAGLVVAAALAIGVVGYHVFEGLDWLDSLLNAAMILGGMGPVSDLHHPAAKWFAAGYALFSGIVFIAICGVLFAPVFHRFLHRFHLEQDVPSGHQRPPSPPGGS